MKQLKTTYIYYLHWGDNVPFYIGKSINPLSRMYNHRRKWGKEVLLEIIDEVPTLEWRFWEKYYICLFKGWGFILENLNNGGGGIPFHSFKSKCQISKNKTNHPCYKNSVRGKKISNTKKNIPNPKLSLSRKGKPHPKKFTKPILQYDMNGNFVKEWEGTSVANKHYKGVHNALNGRAKTAHGFIWKYKN